MKKVLVLVISTVLLVGCVDSNVNTPPVQTDLSLKTDLPEVATETKKENYVLGETVMLIEDNVRITVFEGQAEIDDFSVNYAKERGDKHLSYEVLVESGDMPQNFSVNSMYFELKDVNGYTYTPSFDGKKLLGASDLSSNSKSRGFITFKVPEGTIPWQIIYNDFTYQVIWELSSQETNSPPQL